MTARRRRPNRHPWFLRAPAFLDGGDRARRLLPLALALLVAAPWSAAQTAAAAPAAAAVPAEEQTVSSRREAILEMAGAYAAHAWRASEANRLHGPDADGVPVDTPDADHHEGGWQADGTVNHGIPYKWGGFSSLDDFDQGVAGGMAAGQLTDGVSLLASDRAVGVDCSGFVARCWNLPFKQSTRSLGRLSFELDGYEELQPGDLINKYDAHAMIFAGFADDDPDQVRVFEAAFPKVKESVYPVDRLEAAGFRPFRYKPLDSRWLDVSLGESQLRLPESRGEWIADDEAAPLDLDALPDRLARAGAGDWVRYELRGEDADGPVMLVTRAVAATGDDGIDVQTTSALGEGQLETLETHLVTSRLVDRLVAMRDQGQPLDELNLVDQRVTSGTWVDGNERLPGRRVELTFEGSYTARSQPVALTLRLDAVLSDAVPLEGVVWLQRDSEMRHAEGEGRWITTQELAAFGRGGGSP